MNTIFIDLKENKKIQNHKSTNNAKNKFNIGSIFGKLDYLNDLIFKHSFKKDIINNKNYNNKIHLSFNRKYLKSRINKDKLNITDRLIKRYIQFRIGNLNDIYIVFSKEFDEDTLYKKYIMSLLYNKKTNKEMIEIEAKNSILSNDFMYIDDFIKENKINVNKLKILVIIDNISDYNNEKIIEYISKYKFIDVLRTNNIKKSEYKNILEKIDAINNEYGTSIELIQKRNLTEYNIYLSYSNISLIEFKSHYIIKKDYKYINFRDPDDDILSKEYLEYENNKYYIETVFNRLKISIDNYSKNKLGTWYKLDNNM